MTGNLLLVASRAPRRSVELTASVPDSTLLQLPTSAAPTSTPTNKIKKDSKKLRFGTASTNFEESSVSLNHLEKIGSKIPEHSRQSLPGKCLSTRSFSTK